MIVKVFPSFGSAIIPLPRDRRITIPAWSFSAAPRYYFPWNKTGTLLEGMLYVDNPGIVGLAGSVSV
jgi:hypothetical protein